MKTLIGLALFAFPAMLIAPSRASASTVGDCQALIVTLEADTAAGTYLRGDLGVKLENQLMHHLVQASDELTLNDPKEALRQMGWYQTDLARGADAGKIDPASAAMLQTESGGVITCIQQIVP